jgi:hypothetical protein
LKTNLTLTISHKSADLVHVQLHVCYVNMLLCFDIWLCFVPEAHRNTKLDIYVFISGINPTITVHGWYDIQKTTFKCNDWLILNLQTMNCKIIWTERHIMIFKTLLKKTLLSNANPTKNGDGPRYSEEIITLCILCSPFTLDCPFLITPMSPVTLDCPFLIAPMSPVTLDCVFFVHWKSRTHINTYGKPKFKSSSKAATLNQSAGTTCRFII